MARRSFRDRFFTPPVARAMTSPLGIVLAGAGAAVGLAVGSVPAAIALAIVAWGGRVAAAVPRDPRPDRIDPFTLGDPWKRMVQDAVQAQSRFAEAINETHGGPLRERMEEIGQRIAVGVQEAWRVGRSGQAMMEARRRIDTADAERELAEVEAAGAATEPGSARELTKKSLHAQIASAQRLDHTIAEARDRLRLTNARLDEAVARAAELSIQAGDVHDLQGLGDDVDSLVDDLEALRLGLEELDRPSTGTS
jgi:hypothetical protein